MRLGVAIEAGGARCAAAAGALLALEEAGIVPWAYAGCGAGALVAALAACRLLNEQTVLAYRQAAGPWRGVCEGRVRALVHRQFHGKLLREQPPLAMPAIDLQSGAVQVLASALPARADPRPWSRQALVATAVLASMAAPGALPPVCWRGRWLCGGGMTRAVLPQLLRAMGADCVLCMRVLDAGCAQWETHPAARSLCAHAVIAAPLPQAEHTLVMDGFAPKRGVLDCRALESFLQAGRAAAQRVLPELKPSVYPAGNILPFPVRR